MAFLPVHEYVDQTGVCATEETRRWVSTSGAVCPGERGSRGAARRGWAGGRSCGILPGEATAAGQSQTPPAVRQSLPRSLLMPVRAILDGFGITPIEPVGSLHAGTDAGRLFIYDARTG